MDNNRIIWVDDKFGSNYKLFNQVNALKEEGFDVVTYTSAIDFMADFDKNPSKYVCAIIDLVLPRNDSGDPFETGLSLINKVRATNQEINIIAYTGMIIEDDISNKFVKNKVKYLNKFQDDILRTVKSILKS